MKSLIAILLFSVASIYSIQITDINGSSLPLVNYRGKKILIVNIATNSSRVKQIGELQQLHRQFGDRVVIIGFPSNSFSHETRSNAEINQFCLGQFGVTFLLAAKNSVSGPTRQPVYSWLANSNENGTISTEPTGDFQKYLINEEGKVMGVFSPVVSPMDSLIINAIKEN